jgi:hypothetical protein
VAVGEVAVSEVYLVQAVLVGAVAVGAVVVAAAGAMVYFGVVAANIAAANVGAVGGRARSSDRVNAAGVIFVGQSRVHAARSRQTPPDWCYAGGPRRGPTRTVGVVGTTSDQSVFKPTPAPLVLDATGDPSVFET